MKNPYEPPPLQEFRKGSTVFGDIVAVVLVPVAIVLILLELVIDVLKAAVDATADWAYNGGGWLHRFRFWFRESQ